MADYKISIQAEFDIDQIYEYGLDQFGEARADKHHMEIYGQFEFISEHPDLYPISEVTGFRKSVFGPYSIYYRILDNDDVYIVRILSRQDQNRVFQ